MLVHEANLVVFAALENVSATQLSVVLGGFLGVVNGEALGSEFEHVGGDGAAIAERMDEDVPDANANLTLAGEVDALAMQ